MIGHPVLLGIKQVPKQAYFCTMSASMGAFRAKLADKEKSQTGRQREKQTYKKPKLRKWNPNPHT
jgi:hypothetical protein